MRILRLVARDRWMLEFHPYVTVVDEPDQERCREIIDAFVAVVRGERPALDGLLEAHGVVLDLSDESLDLLELGDVDLDITVTDRGLPESASSPEARRIRSAERRLDLLREPLETARASHEAARRRVAAAEAALTAATTRLERATELETRLAVGEAALAAAEAQVAEAATAAEEAAAALADAESSVADLTERAAVLEARLADVEADATARRAAALAEREARRRALEAAQAALDGEEHDLRAELSQLAEDRASVSSRIDPDAASVLEQATAALRAHDDALTAARDAAAHAEDSRPHHDDPDTAGPPTTDDADVDVADANRRAEEALHRSYDGAALADALAAALDTSGQQDRSSTADAALAARFDTVADSIDAVDRELAALQPAIDENAASLTEADEEVASAARELETVQAAARAPRLSEEARDEIERLHRAVEEAEERLDGRRGRKGAQQDFDDARAAERALLESLGFHSYTDYLTGSSMSRDDSLLDDLERARRRLQEAEAERRDRRAALGVDRLEALKAERAALTAQAEELVVRADATRPSPRRVEDDLSTALDRVGLPTAGLDLGIAELIELAVDWLAEHDAWGATLVDEPVGRADVGGSDRAEPAAPAGVRPVEAPGEVDVVDPEPAVGPSEEELAEQRRALEDARRDAERRVEAASTAAAEFEAIEARIVIVEEALAAILSARSSDADADADLDADLDADADIVPPDGRTAAELEAELAEITAMLADARAELPKRAVEHEHRLRDLQDVERAAIERRDALTSLGSEGVADAAAAVASAGSSVRLARSDLAGAEATLREMETRVDTQQALVDDLRATVGPEVERTSPEEVEWYLLERLAAHRDRGFAGSVPMVIDGVFDAISDSDLRRVMDRLCRLAGSVQVVIFSADERVRQWAAGAGEQSAVVIRPSVASVGSTSD